MWNFVITLVINLALSYLAPRPSAATPTPGEYQAPQAIEGRPVVKVYGTCWIDDAQMLGFRRMGTDAIRKKGGKK